MGHAQNVTFSITLDAGETRGAGGQLTAASQHPFGTVVNSDKPIAITISDDSLNGTTADVSICLETKSSPQTSWAEYIAIKGNLNGPDKAFIPTEPNTTISVNGNVVTTLTNLTSSTPHPVRNRRLL